MLKTFDARYPFRGLRGCPSHCHLRLYVPSRGERRAPVAIVTQCWDRPGTSVTNWAEHLAFAVWSTLQVDHPHRPEDLVWIENYQPAPPGFPASLPVFKNEFDQVTFAPVLDQDGRPVGLAAPQWREISREEVERLVGKPIEVVDAPPLLPVAA